MGIRSAAFDAELTAQAIVDPFTILSNDPLADAWGLELGAAVSVTMLRQTVPERDMLHFDKAWWALLALTGRALRVAPREPPSGCSRADTDGQGRVRDSSFGPVIGRTNRQQSPRTAPITSGPNPCRWGPAILGPRSRVAATTPRGGRAATGAAPVLPEEDLASAVAGGQAASSRRGSMMRSPTMSPQPLLPGEGAFPADQIRIPCPPSRFESSTGGVLRRPHGVPVAESYRRNVVRIWLGGADQDVVDLVPDTDTVTTGPASLFGPDCGPVFFLSGTQAFGRLTTRDEDAATLRALRWRLDFDSWDWCPAVATSPDRQWIESGALIRDVDADAAVDRARFHGQSVILCWDDEGLAPLATIPGVNVGDPSPGPVRLVPAATGCPLRGGVDGVCKVYGGPWTSSAMAAALVWRHHRAILLDAFGCNVCHGDGGGGAVGFVDLFTPSRDGGWQWGPPRTGSEE